jgi:hypothetical protein
MLHVGLLTPALAGQWLTGAHRATCVDKCIAEAHRSATSFNAGRHGNCATSSQRGYPQSRRPADLRRYRPPESASSSTSRLWNWRNHGVWARYYRARPAPTCTGYKRWATRVIDLNFGPHKGLYAGPGGHARSGLRAPVDRAQRPEVRACASRLVEAIDAAAEHKKRSSRSSSRSRAPS